MKSSKSPFKFREHRHSVLKVPDSLYPQMCTGLPVLSTGKSAPHTAGWKGGCPGTTHTKAKLWPSQLLSWGLTNVSFGCINFKII